MIRKLPGFLCIGAQKAGTSWLWTQLKQHPDIWMPPIKELHFFDHNYCPENRSWTTWHIQTHVLSCIKWHISVYDKPDFAYLHYLAGLAKDKMFTEAWYKRAFMRPVARGKLLGDITPEYSTLPQEGVEYVKQYLGEIKIIYIIRDPMDRALSQMRMNLQSKGDLAQLNLQELMDMANIPAIENRGNYATYIPRWLSVFDASSIKFVPFGLIKKEPDSLILEITRFLGLEDWGGYKALTQPVYSTQEVAIPDEALPHLRELCQPQYEFLNSQFGQEFVSLTK